ncbi:MAG TPA: MFS transporter [bacterium]|nr:MFS transporter [bacterium]
MPRSARVAIGFSNATHYLTHLFMLLYPTAVLGLEQEFHLPYGQLISLSLGGFILFGAGALPAGWLADRWSEIGMLAVLLFGMGGAALLTGLAPSPLWVALGLALMGLFASIYHPVGIAMIVRHAEKRGRALGINGVSGGLGLASGALVAGALMDWWSWRAAFIVPGLVAMALGVVFLVAVRLTGLRDTREDAHPQPEVGGHAMVSAFLTLTVTTMMAGLIFQSTSVALPKIFAQRLGLFAGGNGALDVGGFVSLVYLGAASVQVFGGILADRFPLKWVYVAAYTVQVPVILLAARLYNWPLVGVCMAMVLLQNGAAPAESALYARYSPARWRATAFGLKFVVSLGVSALGVPLVALIYDGTGGFYWLFVAMAAFALTAASVGLLLPGERGLAATTPLPAGAAGGSDD